MSMGERTCVRSSDSCFTRSSCPFPPLCMPAKQAICITTDRFNQENVYDQGLYCVTLGLRTIIFIAMSKILNPTKN